MKKSNVNLCLSVGIIVLLIGLVLLYTRKQENFETLNAGVDIQHPDHILRNYAQIISDSDLGNEEAVDSDSNNESNEAGPPSVDLSNYVRKTDLEKSSPCIYT